MSGVANPIEVPPLNSARPDADLLAAHAAGDPAAFPALVGRHAGWVCAAAYRQLGDRHRAEDVTQAVFALLHQRAGQVARHGQLTGWLFTTTRLAARNAARADRRRQAHERRAAMERTEVQPAPPPLADTLDAAVGRLPEADRVAVLLRFHRGMEFADVAAAIGTSEAAARKRVARAVERLRRWLGGTADEAALTAAAVYGMPVNVPALIAHISQGTALATTVGSPSVAASLSTVAKGAAILMGTSKWTAVAVGLMVLLLAGTAATLILLPSPSVKSAATRPTAVAVASLASPAAAVVDPFEQRYWLANGVDLKRVPPPFSPARLAYYRRTSPGQAHAIPRGPDAMYLRWDGDRLGRPWAMTFGKGWGVADLLNYGIGVSGQEVDGDRAVLDMTPPGDIVVRQGVSPDRFLAALTALLRDEFHTPTVMAFRDVARPVVVLKGAWKRRVTTDHGIEFYGTTLNADPNVGGGGSGSQKEFAQWLGDWIKRPVVMDVTGGPHELSWHLNDVADGTADGRSHAHDPDLVLRHVGEQTGLTWAEETRTVRRLFVERAP